MTIRYIHKAYVNTNRKIPDFLIERLHGNTWDTLYRAIEELTNIEIDDRVFKILRDFFIETSTAEGLKKWESFYLPKPHILSTERWRTLLFILTEITTKGPTVENVLKLIRFFDPLATLTKLETLPLYASDSKFLLPPPPQESFPTEQSTILASVSKFSNIYQDYYANPTKEFLLFSNSTLVYETSNLNILEVELRRFLKNLLDLVIPANVHIILRYNINLYQLLCYSGITIGEDKQLIEYDIINSTNITIKLNNEYIDGRNKFWYGTWVVNTDKRLFQFMQELWLYSISENTYTRLFIPKGQYILSVTVCFPDRIYVVSLDLSVGGQKTFLYRYDLRLKEWHELTPMFFESDEYIDSVKAFPNNNGLLVSTTNNGGTKKRIYTLDTDGKTQAYFFNMVNTIYPIMGAIDFYSLVAFDPLTKKIKFFEINLDSSWTPSSTGSGSYKELQFTFNLSSMAAFSYNNIVFVSSEPDRKLYKIKFNQDTTPSSIANLTYDYNVIYISPDKNDLVLYKSYANPAVAIVSNYNTYPTVVEKLVNLLPVPISYGIINR